LSPRRDHLGRGARDPDREALEVQHGDGLVEQQLFALPVNAKPADIPAVIEVDITDLIIGGAIRIADVTLPAGVTTDLEDDVSIVMGQASRVVAVEGEEEEGAEGAVAAPVEGAAESTDSEG